MDFYTGIGGGAGKGWADCGTDRQGRPIGYAFQATCDHPGCLETIDRGLAFACGETHGEDECSCDKYFCEKHKSNVVTQPWGNGRMVGVCDECFKACLEAGYDPEEDRWEP